MPSQAPNSEHLAPQQLEFLQLQTPQSCSRKLETPASCRDKFIKELAEANSYSINRESLSGGAQLLTVDIKTPFSFVGVIFNAGSKYEQEGQHGMLHFFEHLPPSSYAHNPELQQLIKQKLGVTYELPNQFLNLARQRGWEQRIFINEDVLVCGVSAPHYDRDAAITLLSGILDAPLAAYQNSFETERSRIVNEIESSAHDFGRQVFQFIKSSCAQIEQEKHAPTGNVEEVQGHSFQQVWQLSQQHITPSNTTFLYIGEGEVPENVRNNFSTMKLFEKARNTLLTPSTSDKSPTTTPKASPLIEESGPFYARHKSCAFAFFTGHIDQGRSKEFYALQLIADYASQKLDSDLSHKQGLVYKLVYVPHILSKGNFTHTFILECPPNNMIKAVPILAQWCSKLSATLDHAAIEMIKTVAKNRFLGTVSTTTVFYNLVETVAKPERPQVTCAEEYALIDSLTLEDLQDAARKLFGTTTEPKGNFRYWIPEQLRGQIAQHQAKLINPWSYTSD